VAKVDEKSHNDQKEEEPGKTDLRIIDDVLHQCAKELKFLADVYKKHGLQDHAQELYIASENIRTGPADSKHPSSENDKAS